MKRKIKNFSDFMECIKAGKKVTDNDDKLFYYFENGCICCKDKEGFVWYNTYVDTNDLSRIVVEEQEPLKIEVGKSYKTRDGIMARCFFADKSFRFFKFTIDGLSDVFETNSKGEHLIPGRFENEEMPNDIVGYGEE